MTEEYILQGICDGNSYFCVLSCDDRNRNLNFHTNNKV